MKICAHYGKNATLRARRVGDLKTTYRRMISALGMPRAIRDYCEAVTRFTAKRGPRVCEVIGTTVVQKPWHQPNQYVQRPCDCANLPASIPRIDGCVFARRGADL